MIPLYNKPKLTGDAGFELISAFEPAGDQPQAIQELVDGLKREEKNQRAYVVRRGRFVL